MTKQKRTFVVVFLCAAGAIAAATSFAEDNAAHHCTAKALADNPLLAQRAKRPSSEEIRSYVLRICGTSRDGGRSALATPDQQRRYLALISDQLLATYDLNCDLRLSACEKDLFVSRQAADINRRFSQAVEDATEATGYAAGLWEAASEKSGQPIAESDALAVVPSIVAEVNKISLGATVTSAENQRTQLAKISYMASGKEQVALSQNSRLTTGFSWDLTRTEADTPTSSTLTRAADFLPLSLTSKPTENLTLSLSAGIGWISTDELNTMTAVRKKEINWAYSYKAGFTYQTPLPCLAFGVDYKIRTDNFASEKLSNDWIPSVTFDLTKPCN